MDPVALAGMEVDEAGIAEVTVEWPLRSVRLSVLEVEEVKFVGAVVSDGLGRVTTVPLKKETFRVEVKVIVVVMSEVEVAEEL
jgi:hypothetical protein